MTYYWHENALHPPFILFRKHLHISYSKQIWRTYPVVQRRSHPTAPAPKLWLPQTSQIRILGTVENDQKARGSRGNHRSLYIFRHRRIFQLKTAIFRKSAGERHANRDRHFTTTARTTVASAHGRLDCHMHGRLGPGAQLIWQGLANAMCKKSGK